MKAGTFNAFGNRARSPKGMPKATPKPAKPATGAQKQSLLATPTTSDPEDRSGAGERYDYQGQCHQEDSDESAGSGFGTDLTGE